ncbi:hypothetical protein DV737_g815, partial [Chaetothyriales sp. CBS 132003]
MEAPVSAQQGQNGPWKPRQRPFDTSPPIKWEVKIKNHTTGEVFIDTSHFFVEAAGRLNVPQSPDIPGLATDFKGIVVHTSQWTDELTHSAHRFTEEEKERFDKDPQAYLEYRRGTEKHLHGRFDGAIAGSEINQKMRQAFRASISARVGGDKAWLDRLVPEYAPLCKRPTPSPGYIEAIRDSKVEYIDDARILNATADGLLTEDGKERKADIIVTATGFKNGFQPFFPTLGKDGLDLSKYWAADGPIGYPKAYFGIMAPNFPNYFAVIQANSVAVGGSYPLNTEISATYIAKVIRKVQSQGYRAIHPSQEATDDFNEIIEAYFEDKVIGDECSSWWKSGFGKSRPLLQWPGTGHHRFDISRDPRWEDFIFERSAEGRRNRFEYFGNGFTEREKGGDEVSLTKYLKERDGEEIWLDEKSAGLQLHSRCPNRLLPTTKGNNARLLSSTSALRSSTTPMADTDITASVAGDSSTIITPESLEATLSSKINTTYVAIEDMSGGCGQAFNAIIVSPDFDKKTHLQRHRLVNNALKAEIAAIHAWTPRCLTPAQWEQEQARQQA